MILSKHIYHPIQQGLVIFLLSTTGCGLMGCSPSSDTRGYDIELRDFKKIVPGTSTKQSVEEQFGSPSTVSTFKPEVWYYVSKKTETTSFFNPVVVDQRTYAVAFDVSGRVTQVVERTGDDMRIITPVARETPTAGHDHSLLREMFSNFGKISTQGGKRTP
jgi:outer membrane protein assembly factor BamE (lipoprotein component of BamABCDE complex)